MAEDRMAVLERPRKHPEGTREAEADFLWGGLCWLAQKLIEARVAAQIGAARYERS